MARLTHVNACLLATFIVAGAMPAAAAPNLGAVDDLAAYGPSCVRSGDDSGWGGSHVSCKYSCTKETLLSIAVNANDPDASTYADTQCGGTEAHCSLPSPSCTGVSPGLTNENQAKASCNGHTDEAIDSPVTVACASSGDAMGFICQVIKDPCNFDGVTPPGEVEPPTVPETPRIKKPEINLVTAIAECALDLVPAGPAFAAGLAATGLPSFATFVVFMHDANGASVIEWDGAVCTHQQL